MKSVLPDYDDNFMEHACNSQPSPPNSPDINDIVGAPQLSPRLGDEFQVEIPSMITESERTQLLMNPAESEVTHDISHAFVMGLPISVIWVSNDMEDGEDEVWGYLGDNDGTVSVIEPAEAINVKKNSTSEKGRKLRPTTIKSVMTGESKSGRRGKIKIYGMVPGKLSSSWSDADVNSFLLGLFIFGKNFNRIKIFLENKEMGDILSFYYGEFYKSDGHRRWSDCRKIKGRRCMIGQKLFTGWRQHELLSRLISHSSEGTKDTLLQVSRSYVEGRASLEEYISSLKSTVGLSILVEAIGIGKEKEDLTSLAVEPGKNNQVFKKSAGAPTSKDWSTLGPRDIMKFLTGEFRLSKAKSNDLFWEAVWPRLLARGWHSEQPKNQGFVNSKYYLVFLIPGIKKFSRRKLVKGDHYFDSVSDVLSKVVSEPNLLELEVEDTKVGCCNEENGSIPDMSSDEDDQSDYNRHCYLKPRVSTYNSDHMKFTVVDTSLVHGGNPSDLRQLKHLPLGLKLTSKETNKVGCKESNSSGNSLGQIELDAAGRTYIGDKHIGVANHRKDIDSLNQKLTKFTVVDTTLLHCGKLSRGKKYTPVELKDTLKLSGPLGESDGNLSDNASDGTEATMQFESKRNISNADCHKSISDRDATKQHEVDDKKDCNANKMVVGLQNQKTCVPGYKQLKKTIKQQFSRKVKLGHSKLAAPPTKRRRLTACAKDETSRILENYLGDSEKIGPSEQLSFPDSSKNVGYPVSHQENVCLSPSSNELSVEEDTKGSNLSTNSHGMGMSFDKVEKCDSLPTSNLNLTQLSLKSESGEMMAMVEEDGPHLKVNGSCFTSDEQELVPKSLTTSCDVGSIEQKPDINPRRQSNRTRPLTVRALESLANEFLHAQRRPQKNDVPTLREMFSPCRRARSRGKKSLHRHSSGVEDKHFNGDYSINDNISKPMDHIEG